MSSPELWVVALLRWLLLCALAVVLAVTAVLTPPQAPIGSLSYQHRMSQR